MLLQCEGDWHHQGQRAFRLRRFQCGRVPSLINVPSDVEVCNADVPLLVLTDRASITRLAGEIFYPQTANLSGPQTSEEREGHDQPALRVFVKSSENC